MRRSPSTCRPSRNIWVRASPAYIPNRSCSIRFRLRKRKKAASVVQGGAPPQSRERAETGQAGPAAPNGRDRHGRHGENRAVPQRVDQQSVTFGPFASPLLKKITETIPFHLSIGDRTAQSHLPRTDSDHFPVAGPRAFLDSYLLPDFEGISPENDEFSCLHISPLSELPQTGQYP